MSVLRSFSVIVCSFSLILGLEAQQTVEKTLVKSFNLQGNDVIDLDLEGDIQLKEWNSPAIRIEMLITLDNGNETMLKSLIKAGRYNLKSTETEDSFHISIPGLAREVTVKGVSLVDKVSYIVSLPADVNIREVDLATAQAID